MTVIEVSSDEDNDDDDDDGDTVPDDADNPNGDDDQGRVVTMIVEEIHTIIKSGVVFSRRKALFNPFERVLGTFFPYASLSREWRDRNCLD